MRLMTGGTDRIYRTVKLPETASRDTSYESRLYETANIYGEPVSVGVPGICGNLVLFTGNERRDIAGKYSPIDPKTGKPRKEPISNASMLACIGVGLPLLFLISAGIKRKNEKE